MAQTEPNDDQRLPSPEDRFRLRALWVIGTGLILYVSAVTVQRMLSETINDSNPWRIYVVVSLCVATLVALWVRWYGPTFVRAAIYGNAVTQVSFIANHGGVDSIYVMTALIYPPLCALLFGRRETAVFSVVLCLSLISLYLLHERLPPFALEPEARRQVTAIIVGAVIVANVIVLLIFAAESERNDSRLRALLDEQVHAANHDALTGLHNRAAVNDYLERLTKTDQVVRIYLIDLDGFKHVNDTFGHAAGDEVLMQVAKALRSTVPQAGLAARLGGDEFVVALPAQSEAEDDAGAALVRALDITMSLGDAQARVTASVGSAEYPTDSADKSDILRWADVALYAAKSAGKSRHVRYSNGSNATASDLRKAG